MHNFIPPIPSKLTKRLLPSSDIAINSIAISIDSLNRFMQLLPVQYGWRFRTVDALKAEILEAAPSGEPLVMNRVYWEDMLKTCEAYTVMNSWRIMELARSCVWALGREDVACAAIVARSALENTAQFADAARTISATLDNSATADFKKVIATSLDLETFLLKTVFASRLPDNDAIYNPTNILTILKRIGKIEGQGFIETTHQELCEITHPNFLGRSLYIVSSKPNNRPGDEIRTLSLRKGPTADLAIMPTVRGLSWACMTHVTAALLLQKSIGAFAPKLTR